MRIPLRTAAVVAALMGAAARAHAQVPTTAAVDSLRRIVLGLDARLDSLDAGHCPAPVAATPPRSTGSASLDSLATSVFRLATRLDAAISQRCAGAGRAPQLAATDTTDPLAAIRAAADSAAAAAGAPSSPDSTGPPPIAPASGQRSQSILNPEISATGDVQFATETGVAGPVMDLTEVEVALQAALDPYSATKIFLSWSPEEIGVEEAYIYWSGLPGKFRGDLGKYRMAVGDLNRWHRHALPETNYPLVYQAFLGEDGLSGVGVSLYNILPVSIAKGTSEVYLQAAAIESEPLNDLSYQPALLGRLQNFWQLSRSTYMQLGFTGIAAQNGDSNLTSNLLGADFRLTIRPPDSGTRKDITVRAEGYRLQRIGEEPTTTRYGMFADLAWRLDRRWIVGGRYDHVEAPFGPDATTWRGTLVATWWQSEFVALRLQAFRNHTEATGSLDNLTLQVVWAMGPHKHETY